jgi:hypothetical protein
MYKSVIFAINITLLLVLVSGCGDRCDDFNNDIVSWMPYKVNEKIVLSDSVNTQTLVVHYCQITHSDKLSSGSTCLCSDSYSLIMSSDLFYLDVQFISSKVLEDSYIEINHEELIFSEELDSLELNGNVYQDVVVYLSTDPNFYGNYNKIIISKSIGILAIIGDANQYFVVDDAKRQVDVASVDVIGADC